MPSRKTGFADLLRALDRLSTASARELGAALGVSQQTVSRLLADVADQVVRFGRTKGARYARVRSVEGLGSKVPVFRVSETGSVTEEGTLHLLSGARHWLQREDRPPVLFEGQPPFVADMSPQGYLGRDFADRNPDLSLPARPQDWSTDHLLIAVSRRGEDSVGNLILGQESLDRHLASSLTTDSPHDYPERARTAHLRAAGSSAGGERPKFLAFDGERHLLIKFEGGDAPDAQRWRDLLACESLALEVVRESGMPASENRVVDEGGMRFLEVVRFDRAGARGRIGVISLGAWDDAYLGRGGDWIETTDAMRARRLLSEEDARAVRRLDTFGALIANSDRHRENLTFFADPTEASPLRLAPADDMLPMHFAPRPTGVEAPAFVPPPPRAATHDVWASAAEAAVEFWRRVARDARISEDFHLIAERCGQAVEAERRRLASILPAS